jgi:dethiobiotin synthetase
MTDCRLPAARTGAGGLFVVGSDTEVGKTWVACRLIEALKGTYPRVGAFKPVASGVDKISQSDGYQLWSVLGGHTPLEWVCPQSFLAPVAPGHAAALEGRAVDAAKIDQGFQRWRERVDLLVVEGAGGLLSPLTDGLTNADLAQQWGLPLVVVIPNRLGAINQCLLTLEAASHRRLEVMAVILNTTQSGPPHPATTRHVASIEQLLLKQSRPIPPILELSYQQTELPKEFLTRLVTSIGRSC